MSVKEIHYGDEGTELRVTIKDGDSAVTDISEVSSVQFIFFKPGGTTDTVTASLHTDGTDGIAKYITPLSFWDEVGYWKLQALVTWPASKFYSDKYKFKVHCNLD